jgi:hypothetical protein
LHSRSIPNPNYSCYDGGNARENKPKHFGDGTLSRQSDLSPQNIATAADISLASWIPLLTVTQNNAKYVEELLLGLHKHLLDSKLYAEQQPSGPETHTSPYRELQSTDELTVPEVYLVLTRYLKQSQQEYRARFIQEVNDLDTLQAEIDSLCESPAMRQGKDLLIEQELLDEEMTELIRALDQLELAMTHPDHHDDIIGIPLNAPLFRKAAHISKQLDQEDLEEALSQDQLLKERLQTCYRNYKSSSKKMTTWDTNSSDLTSELDKEITPKLQHLIKQRRLLATAHPFKKSSDPDVDLLDQIMKQLSPPQAQTYQRLYDYLKLRPDITRLILDFSTTLNTLCLYLFDKIILDTRQADNDSFKRLLPTYFFPDDETLDDTTGVGFSDIIIVPGYQCDSTTVTFHAVMRSVKELRVRQLNPHPSQSNIYRLFDTAKQDPALAKKGMRRQSATSHLELNDNHDNDEPAASSTTPGRRRSRSCNIL